MDRFVMTEEGRDHALTIVSAQITFAGIRRNNPGGSFCLKANTHPPWVYIVRSGSVIGERKPLSFDCAATPL